MNLFCLFLPTIHFSFHLHVSILVFILFLVLFRSGIALDGTIMVSFPLDWIGLDWIGLDWLTGSSPSVDHIERHQCVARGICEDI